MITKPYALVLRQPDGMPSGRCAGEPDAMSPEPGDTVGEEIAREMCLGCPVYVSCLAWIQALPRRQDTSDGVIAALTAKEREGGQLPKTCTSCSVVQPASEYAVRNRTTGLRRTVCKACTHAQKCARQRQGQVAA